jgi:hypothetical protein
MAAALKKGKKGKKGKKKKAPAPAAPVPAAATGGKDSALKKTGTSLSVK